MKKIIAIVSRDVKSGTRDWLIMYLAIAPILIALVLKALIPGVSDTTLNVVLLEDTKGEVKTHIETYAKVTYVDDQAALEERVLRMDDVFGLTIDQDNYAIISQGNEVYNMVQLFSSVIDQYRYKDLDIKAEVITSDMGWTMSPIKLYGTIIVIMFTTILGGMMIVLNLVEEKMSNTLSAINVTPTSRVELIAGKGLLGFILSIFGAYITIFILGFSDINTAMLAVTVFCLAWISVIIGFGIGVVNDEPISAVASMKMTFVPLLASVFGAMYLPAKWMFVLYWSPFYWAYINIKDVLMQEGIWSEILMRNAFILVITGLVFVGLKSRIKRGLN